MARDAKNNKKGFYRCVSQKRKVKERVLLLMSKTGKQVRMYEEKSEVLNNFFASLAISLTTPLEWMDHKMGIGAAKSLPF